MNDAERLGKERQRKLLDFTHKMCLVTSLRAVSEREGKKSDMSGFKTKCTIRKWS